MKAEDSHSRAAYNDFMRDLLYVGVIVVFFVLAAAYVRACAHISGE